MYGAPFVSNLNAFNGIFNMLDDSESSVRVIDQDNQMNIMNIKCFVLVTSGYP